MIRNLKILGLAVMAILAISAMTASAGQAAPYWFKSDAAAGKTTKLVGEQKLRQPGNLVDELTFTAGTFKCVNLNYTGSIVGPTTTTITLNPLYSACTFSGFTPTINTIGCAFVFHAEEATAGGIYHATMTLECEAGKEITIAASVAGINKCTIHIEPQNLGTVTFTNGTKASGKKDIHGEINLSGVKYTQTAGEGVGKCATTGTETTGAYVGTLTLSGLNEGGAETDLSLE